MFSTISRRNRLGQEPRILAYKISGLTNTVLVTREQPSHRDGMEEKRESGIHRERGNSFIREKCETGSIRDYLHFH